MITFEIISHYENDKKTVLAKVVDESTAYLLTNHYRKLYSDRDRFTVTRRYPRKKAVRIN